MTLFSILNFFIPSVFAGGKYLILLGAILGVLYYLMGVNFSRKSNDIIVKTKKGILEYRGGKWWNC